MISVMIPQLNDFQAVIAGAIDKPVLVVDAAGPAAGQTVTQRFRLADAGKWVAQGFPDQGVDALEHALVGGLPVQVILPGMA